jgi:hypothetical protein
MTGPDKGPALSEEQRREIFAALVAAQDGRMGVVKSRKEVAQRFGLTDRELRRIEEEGVDGDWPPLTA